MKFPVREEDRPRIAAILEGTQPPAPARDAATIALVRDGLDGLEVYLMRRVRGMAFAAGMHVFPGGSVDPQDGVGSPWVGPDPHWWATAFTADPERAAALVRAAVRETFEECGVLLAGPAGGGVLDDVDAPEWERDRLALDARELTLAQLLADRGLVLRADLLVPLAHWITPVLEPRRYDTRFFLAALPAGQQGRHAGSEADARLWIRPADALGQGLTLMPPTKAVLAELARYDDVAQAMAAEREIVPVMPTFRLDGEDLVLDLE